MTSSEKTTLDTLVSNHTANFANNAIILLTSSGTNETSTIITSSQTVNRTLILPDITDTLITKTTTDILTNKTITSTTNNIAANSLKTATGIVTVSSASAPSSNQILRATNSTTATWQTLNIDTITPTTTKGDLLVENGSNVIRLPIGNNNLVLKANSSTSTGIEWGEVSDGGEGEANDITQIGNSGVSTFKQKSGVHLQFKNIDAGDNKISIIDDTSNNTVDILFQPSNVPINDLDTSTPLSVNGGGTGAATLDSGNVLIGAGTNAITSTKSAPSGDFVGTSDTQTLTNKTLTTPTIAQITNSGTLTLPTSTDTLVGRATTDTLTNKTLTTPTIAQITNSGTLTLPTSTDTLVGRATTDTLTNKTITSTTNDIAANSLKSATGIVTVSSATAPTSGQILTATSSTAANWQTPSQYFAAYDAGGNINISSGFTDITWDTEDKKDSAFTHSADSAEVTVNESGDYLIHCHMSIMGSNARTESVIRIMIDTGSGYTESSGTLAYGYHRNNNQNKSTAVTMKYINLSSTNKIKIQATQNTGSGTMRTAPDGCRILIQKI